MNKENRTVWTDMKDRWPSAIVERSRIGEFSGGMVASGTIANADSQKKGPKQRIRMGNKKVGYPVESLVEWIKSRCTIITTMVEQEDNE